MGMYDTLRVLTPLLDPEYQERTFQTKSLECSLSAYTLTHESRLVLRAVEWETDASRAIEAMVLTAWSRGGGANWVGFVGGMDAIKPLLSIPDALDVLAVLAFGYPAAAIGRGKKKRKSLGEVAHREQAGPLMKRSFPPPYEDAIAISTESNGEHIARVIRKRAWFMGTMPVTRSWS